WEATNGRVEAALEKLDGVADVVMLTPFGSAVGTTITNVTVANWSTSAVAPGDWTKTVAPGDALRFLDDVDNATELYLGVTALAYGNGTDETVFSLN
ncbi:unnamed protein product, partial [Phaeothamnion confervicola]